jgi:hypothetical protein
LHLNILSRSRCHDPNAGRNGAETSGPSLAASA